MAVRKNEIGKLTDDELAALQRAEVFIDESLRARYARQSGDVTISLDSIQMRSGFGRPLNNLMIDWIITRYEQAGWQVTRHDDQRNGAYLRFT